MSLFNPDKIQVGISSCLLGDLVRYNGGHKASNFCIHDVAPHVEYVSVCPEMAIGMGTPRPAIRLVKHEDVLHLQSSDGKVDVTEAMQQFAAEKVPELSHLSGYLVCQKSPSCGMERVPEYSAKTGQGTKSGIGMFTQKLMETYPHLPVEEDGRLHDLLIRENFFTRLYAHHDWQKLVHAGLTKHSLIQFHSRYKYLLMAHSPKHYKSMGQLLANMDDLDSIQAIYFHRLMSALAMKPNKKNHTNTLQHLQGYFKKHLSAAQKKELSDAILKYRKGWVPLLVPITLIQHYLMEYPSDYLAQQVYLQPYPESLKLRYAY
jgi:uncharacterized protein YbgA (DUF1722 family)/uncharacterized protein YbbK (DUF523 family)